MGHYGFVKKGDHSKLVVLPEKKAPKSVAVPQQGQVDLPSNFKTVHACTLCEDKVFPKPGLVAAHFARVHNELVEDKNTWRQYHEKREVPIGPDS